MQHLMKLFVVGVSVLMLANSCRTIYPSAEVNYLSGDEQTVTVRAVGIGNGEEKAIINAEQKVFDVLFFRGLPESKQKLPMTGNNENEEKAKHKNYFDNFYDGKRHKTFVMSSIPVSKSTLIKGGQKQIAVDVKVNLSALRRDLETFGVIRKFGF
ncbi:MAG: hypothetical protein LBH61_04490 [Dysgonamonadaceae bacterium]|jgi:hypothetical protein|nr:hypothetical protein [Dysgonamonadaceae bacterium]